MQTIFYNINFLGLFTWAVGKDKAELAIEDCEHLLKSSDIRNKIPFQLADDKCFYQSKKGSLWVQSLESSDKED